jgi:hypothetical protein
MAKELPAGRHILSVELLRINREETAVVLTVVHDQRLVQYELRADAAGGNAKPVVTPRQLQAHLEPGKDVAAQFHAMTLAAALEPGDGGVALGVALGQPPIKEPPQPGAVALGGALLTTTFNLGEQAIDPGSTT